MSERILKALMQLFAVIARPESNYEDREEVVKQFLLQQLNIDLVKEYLGIFQEYYNQYQKRKSEKLRKSIALSSVKVLKICSDINVELTLKQKVIVLLRLLEFIKNDVGEVTEQELEFVYTVSDSFYIPEEEYVRLKAFVIYPFDKIPNSTKMCLIDGEKELDHDKVFHVQIPNLDGQIRIYHVQTSSMYLVRYLKAKELYINGQLMQPDKVYVINPGASIRNPRIKPIYYSDIVTVFNQTKTNEKISFEVDNIVYKFKGGKVGLQPMSFTEETGKLVGIMGASGAGKSTLLNVLNGNYSPTEGSVKINGLDIHKEKDKIEGLIGFVSQDDLLIEELTVFQNLYFNAQLCFGNYSKFQIVRATVEMLKSLGLYEIRNMKVGSPLNKKISGGQRKRLNIALELIREPAVLFLDEPTSGLSSRDSENIMDLLKELALKGKLIYVVIHQPSSDIFKMFDRLLILDTGGYLIYSGDPVDSIIYFKSRSHQANWNESECHICGNVNPEQVFNIVEANVLDEYGNLTSHRKRKPKDWFKHYSDYIVPNEHQAEKNNSRAVPENPFHIPSQLKQFWVFTKRDVLSKLANKQYLVINFFETPILSFFLSYLIKYFNINAEITKGYLYSENDNIPVYIFMSVIVAIFVGLTVSAEEIIKDRLILKREEFLNLSWNSYLASKVSILLLLSSIQAMLFVIVGNSILEISGMYWQYWLVLFSAWMVSILFGLNISNSFKTAVTVYIMIPFLVIPNIILSGIMVKFEKLNPHITEPGTIPFYGEIIPARWAYEALATYQFKENDYERLFYKYDKIASNATYKKDYWLTDLKNKINNIDRYFNYKEKQDELKGNIALLKYEITEENKLFLEKDRKDYIFDNIGALTIENFNEEFKEPLKKHINKLRDYYVAVAKRADQKQDRMKREMQKTEASKEDFINLKQSYYNQALSDFVKNKNAIDAIIEYKNRLYQKIDPIYQDPETNFVLAHFYAPYKRIFNLNIDTYWMNLMVLWFLSIGLYITLYLNLFKKFMDSFGKLSDRFFKEE
ncbi:MAG: ATP-binding cassette domain-containing protein [Bacteroidales bacterium]|nr:ATP-binding cassette domain-containing protein [Bacteroidales bacterium]